MSAEARANGWRGFEGLAVKVDRVMGVKESRSGWEYQCDGMPREMGCGKSVVVSRQFSRVGLKSTGWLVCYGLEGKTETSDITDPAQVVEDHDIVLTFCPSCVKDMQIKETP